MKKILIIYQLLLSTVIFSQNFQWAVTGNTSVGNYVTHDQSGNIYVANTIYVAKYNPTGNILWQKTVTGSDFWIKGIVTDNFGNLYLTVAFGGTVSIGTYTFTSSAGGDSNMFLAKLDSNGSIVWISRSYSDRDSGTDDITIDQQGNPIIVGRFLDSLHLDNFSFVGPNTVQIYIAKYSSNGNCLWAKYVKSSSFSGGYPGPNIRCDVYNNIYIGGHFIGGTVSIDSSSVPSHGSYPDQDVFLGKLDGNGNPLWIKAIGGVGTEYFYNMDTDSLGNTYIAGEFMSQPAHFGTYTLTTSFYDFFIAKYNSSGNCVWAKKGTAPAICAVNDGYYTSNPAFVSKFDTTGSLKWTKTVTGAASCYAITATNNDVFITGTDSGTVNFDTCNTSTSAWKIFIAKLGTPSSAAGIQQIASQPSFSVYPNPTNHLITLNYFSSTQSATTLTVKNSLGQSVYNESLKEISGSFSKQIDLSHLPKGVYFVEIICADDRKIKKIILE